MQSLLRTPEKNPWPLTQVLPGDLNSGPYSTDIPASISFLRPAANDTKMISPCSVSSSLAAEETLPRVAENISGAERKRSNGVEKIYARQDVDFGGHTDITVGQIRTKPSLEMSHSFCIVQSVSKVIRNCQSPTSKWTRAFSLKRMSAFPKQHAQ